MDSVFWLWLGRCLSFRVARGSKLSLRLIPRTPRLILRYLPHLSRSAAAHLLKRKQSGAFIVRESSRATGGTVMALSIRLPRDDPSGLELDHYLIETGKAGIRLEGSPHHFPVLPILLAHYSLHGEELRTKLRLPSILDQCRSRRELQSLALLGQDFWASEAGNDPMAESCMQISTASLQLSTNGPSPLPPNSLASSSPRSGIRTGLTRIDFEKRVPDLSFLEQQVNDPRSQSGTPSPSQQQAELACTCATESVLSESVLSSSASQLTPKPSPSARFKHWLKRPKEPKEPKPPPPGITVSILLFCSSRDELWHMTMNVAFMVGTKGGDLAHYDSLVWELKY